MRFRQTVVLRNSYNVRVGVRLAFALLVAGCGVQVGGGAAHHDQQGDAGIPIDAPIVIDAPPDAAPCTGTVDMEGNCYTFNAMPLDWATAKATCEAAGTHLAIIRSDEQNTAVATLIGTTTIAYLGGTDAATEGTFLWVDGTGLTVFSNFNLGEPNNGNGTHEEDCLVIRGDKADKWDDRPCGPEPGAGGAGQTPVNYPSVCER